MQDLTKPDGYGSRIGPPPGYGEYAEPEDDTIDLRQILSTLWRGKWIVLICAVIALVLAFLAVAQQEPEYRATTTVLFDRQEANVMSGEELLAQTEINSETLQNQIEILRSTSLVGRVVDELNLEANPVFNPALRPPEEGLFDWLSIPPEVDEFLLNIGLKSLPPPPPPPEEAARRLRLNVINSVTGAMDLQPVRGSRVIRVSYTTPNPRLSARLANTTAEQYIVEQLEGKLEATRAATTWLSDRVEQLQQKVEADERAVADARTKLSVEAGQGLEITQQQLSALNTSLSTVRSEVTSLEAQARRLREALNEGRDLGALTEFRASPIIAQLRGEESELLSQQVTLEATVPEEHPARLRVQAQLEETRRKMREEAERVVGAIEVDLRAARDREAALVADVRDLEDKALAQGQASVELRQLERQAEASRILYENLLARLQETDQQEDLQSADARVLSAAEPPLRPESSSRNRTLALGGIVGVMAGIGLVFLLDRLNNTFRSPGQLEQMTGRTVLATVPLAGSSLARKDVIKVLREKPNSSLAESVRNLRTSLLFSNVDQPPKVVMFTSSVPREGKSTTSMLTALTSRQMGKSAIIVDCDLRMPALSKVLADAGEARGSGLLALMDGTATLDEAVFKEPETGLHVLMTRPSERMSGINAADILASHKFRDLVRQLSETYDLVVLDTPPTLVVTDARIVSSLADAVVFVVRWDKTPRAAVTEGLRELSTVEARVAGIALTMVNEARASKYAYDGYSYYKGRYRDYYEA